MAYRVCWSLKREGHEKVRKGLILTKWQEGEIPLDFDDCKKIVNHWNSENEGLHWLEEVPDSDLPKEKEKRIKAGLKEEFIWPF